VQRDCVSVTLARRRMLMLAVQVYFTKRGQADPVYDLRYPPVYSHRIQPSEDGNVWYFPVTGSVDQWLVVRRRGAAADGTACQSGSGPTESVR
jgi:hypothetical protein